MSDLKENQKQNNEAKLISSNEALIIFERNKAGLTRIREDYRRIETLCNNFIVSDPSKALEIIEKWFEDEKKNLTGYFMDYIFLEKLVDIEPYNGDKNQISEYLDRYYPAGYAAIDKEGSVFNFCKKHISHIQVVKEYMPDTILIADLIKYHSDISDLIDSRTTDNKIDKKSESNKLEDLETLQWKIIDNVMIEHRVFHYLNNEWTIYKNRSKKEVGKFIFDLKNKLNEFGINYNDNDLEDHYNLREDFVRKEKYNYGKNLPLFWMNEAIEQLDKELKLLLYTK